MKRLVFTTAIIVALLTAAGLHGIAQADVIYGCYQKNHGQLRIVSNPNECLPSENPITLGSGKAGEYTGEYCWNAIVPGLDPYLMLRLSMYHLGDNNYTISGGRTPGRKSATARYRDGKRTVG